MLLRVAGLMLDQLTWTACLYRHLIQELAHTVRGGDEHIATPCHPLHTNQLHATITVIFSWNPYQQSRDTSRDSIGFPSRELKFSTREKNFCKINILNLNLAYSQIYACTNLDCSCPGGLKASDWSAMRKLSQLVDLGLLFSAVARKRHPGAQTQCKVLHCVQFQISWQLPGEGRSLTRPMIDRPAVARGLLMVASRQHQ